jgi:hypothetical protein
LKAGTQEGDLMETMGWSSQAMLDRYGNQLKQERAIAACKAKPVGQVFRTAI